MSNDLYAKECKVEFNESEIQFYVHIYVKRSQLDNKEGEESIELMSTNPTNLCFDEYVKRRDMRRSYYHLQKSKEVFKLKV